MQINLKKRIFKYSNNPRSTLSEHQRIIVRDFNDKIRDGRIEFESVACLCGKTEFDLICEVDRYGLLQNTVLCINCGLILSNPRMREKEYELFYSSDLYRLCYEGKHYLQVCSEQKYRLDKGRPIYDEIVKIKPITRDSKILELGAGGGWNLLPFLNEGVQVVGMDYSPSLVDLGRQYGIHMRQGGVNDIWGTYDVIILNHVLEHFLNPIEDLKSILEHLSPGGLIYIGVPNIMNFGIGQLQNAHVWYFSPKTFWYYCRLAGLKLLKSGPAEVHHMFGIFESTGNHVEDHNVNELVGHHDEMLSVLRKVEAKELIKRVLSCINLSSPARAVYKRFCSH